MALNLVYSELTMLYHQTPQTGVFQVNNFQTCIYDSSNIIIIQLVGVKYDG